jgi:hypothetical protein
MGRTLAPPVAAAGGLTASQHTANSTHGGRGDDDGVLILGLALAILASLALNAGYLMQHLGSGSAPAVDVRSPVATVRGLLRSPLWTVGMGTNLLGSLMHIGALAIAPITLVQAFAAGGLALVVPASARVTGKRLHRPERVAVVVIVLALVALAISPSAVSVAPAAAGPPLLVLALVLAGAGGLAFVRGARRAAALALVAGLLYGLSDAATKGFTDAAGHGLLAAVLGPWPPVVVTLCAFAFFALQRGLQDGSAATVIVLMTAAMNVIAVAAGVAVFSESFGARTDVAVLHVAAMAVIAAASWRLAAVQARIGEEPPPAPRRRQPQPRPEPVPAVAP